MSSKLGSARRQNAISSHKTSEAENKVILFLISYSVWLIVQVFESASSKDEYLTNMAKLILALQMEDTSTVRMFCGDIFDNG